MLNLMLEARNVYERMGYPMSLEYDIADYLQRGYMIRTPDFLVLGKPVKLFTTTEPHDQWDTVGADAWYIKLLVGSLKALLDMVPYALPFVCFERWVKGNRNLKTYSYKRVKEIACLAQE